MTVRKQWRRHCNVMIKNKEWKKCTECTSQLLSNVTSELVYSHIFKLEEIITGPQIIPQS